MIFTDTNLGTVITTVHLRLAAEQHTDVTRLEGGLGQASPTIRRRIL